MFPCLSSVAYGHIDKCHVLYLRAIKYIFSFNILKHLRLLGWSGFQTKNYYISQKLSKTIQDIKGRNGYHKSVCLKIGVNGN